MALRHILFSVDLFPEGGDLDKSRMRTLCLLEALTLMNQFYLKENPHPQTPLIYKSGVEYKVPEQFKRSSLPQIERLKSLVTKSGSGADRVALDELSDMAGAGENFREIPRILENGGGDCDNLACWRAAELRMLGIDAHPYITWRQRADGGTTYHVIVRYPDGTSEDPSLLLGMSQPARAHDKAEEERKLAERMGDVLQGDLSTTLGPGAPRGKQAVVGEMSFSDGRRALRELHRLARKIA